METAIAATQSELDHQVLEALKRGYATVPFLAQVTGSSPSQVEEFIAAHPKEIRKSLITSDDGQPVYMLNSPLSGVADLWTAFQSLSALKF